MKLSKKRTCNNCVCDGKDCEMFYQRHFVSGIGNVPDEPCLKPMTNKQYLQALTIPVNEKWKNENK